MTGDSSGGDKAQAFDGSGVSLKHEGLVRTDMHCHACNKNFIAELDHGIDGNHVAECPTCGHEHWRVIKAGVVTGERWGSDDGHPKIKARRVWKHDVLQMQTMSASRFIRDLWLEKLR